MKRLSVKAADKALVPDFDALDGGVLRFVGRRHDPSMGPNGAWVPLDEPVSISYRPEYIQELTRGALEPADEFTANLVGKSLKPANKTSNKPAQING